jgi:hypothetical protein
MAFPSPNIGRALLDVPMGDMIREMAFAIADAQIRLDENSIEVAEMMGGLKTITDENGTVTFEDSRIFFGKQNLSLDVIIEQHTSAITRGDQELKTQLANVLSTLTTKVELNTDVGAVAGSYKLLAGVSGAEGELVPQRLSMMELGFAPTFYQFVDTIIEVKISITYTQEVSRSTSVKIANTNKSRSLSAGFSFKRGLDVTSGVNVTTAQVNANYASKYSYRAEGSSLLRTKLVPIPPPAILEERIRQTLENEQPKPAPESPPAPSVA